MKIEIANKCISVLLHSDVLSCSAESFFKAAKERYDGFLSSRQHDITFDFYIDTSLFEEKISNPYDRIEISQEDAGLSIRFPSFKAFYNPQVKRGEIRQGDLNLYYFDSFLRILFSLVLEDEFLLHASGINRGDEGYVFFGPSGSGKTTVAELSTPFPILADDLVIIKRVNGRFYVCGTPFRGPSRMNGINTCVKIRGLYRLQKSKTASINRLSKVQAITELMPNILCFTPEFPIAQKLFEICCEVVEEIPCYEMHFPKSNVFWRYIDDISE